MNSEVKKKIIVPEKLKDVSWGTFFEDQSIELVDIASVSADELYPYKIVATASSDNLLLEKNNVNHLVKSYFEAGENFDLVNLYCSNNKELASLKIHNNLNMGHFIDIVIVDAYKNGFSCNEIRSFLNSLLTYAFQFLNSIQSIEPVEIFFGHTADEFVLQVSVNGKKFEIDKNLYRTCNFLDVTEHTKTSKNMMSALWFKSEELKKLRYYFQRIQVVLKNSTLTSASVNPVFAAEVVAYEPEFQQAAKTAVKNTGFKENNDQELIRIKGSPEDSSSGNVRVTSDKTYIQMEQQMLRMKDLLFKMKEQMKLQKINLDAALAGSKSDPELLEQVAYLEIENAKLNDDKKYLNARLQLTNRKLQILDTNLDTREELLRQNPEQEKEVEILKQQKAELMEKLNSKATNSKELAVQNLEIQKLNEIKALYENKMKEQAAEIKKLDGRVKILATQLQGTLSKLTAPAAGNKNSDNHAKQLEHASNRVAEVTKEYNDKKKEIILVKQENAKLLGKIYELEKKIQHYDKKVA